MSVSAKLNSNHGKGRWGNFACFPVVFRWFWHHEKGYLWSVKISQLCGFCDLRKYSYFKTLHFGFFVISESLINLSSSCGLGRYTRRHKISDFVVVCRLQETFFCLNKSVITEQIPHDSKGENPHVVQTSLTATLQDECYSTRLARHKLDCFWRCEKWRLKVWSYFCSNDRGSATRR